MQDLVSVGLDQRGEIFCIVSQFCFQELHRFLQTFDGMFGLRLEAVEF